LIMAISIRCLLSLFTSHVNEKGASMISLISSDFWLLPIMCNVDTLYFIHCL